MLVEPVALVVDHAERLAGSPAALAVLGTLLRAETTSLRVIVASRRPLDLSIAKARVAGRVHGLGEADLVFSGEYRLARSARACATRSRSSTSVSRGAGQAPRRAQRLVQQARRLGSRPVRERLPYVDSLRAVAALSVLGFHAAFVLGGLGGGGLGPWLAELDVGVVLFFAISGFLLYRPFVAARIEGAPAPSLRDYARRRVLRIVPAYWVALTVIALAVRRAGVFTAEGVPTYYGFAQSLRPETITGGIAQAWTLGVELSFYALLPLLALGMRRLRSGDRARVLRSEAAMLAALFAASVAFKAVVAGVADPGGGAYLPLLISLPAQLDHFVLGMALAVAGAGGGGGRVERLVERAPAVPWLVAAAAFTLLGADLGAGGAVTRELADHALQGVVALGLLLPAVLGAARGGGAVRQLLGRRELAWAGTVSYGVYLWHLDVLRELDASGLPGPAVAGLGLPLSLALGAASWYGIERRFVRGRYLRRRGRG